MKTRPFFNEIQYLLDYVERREAADLQNKLWDRTYEDLVNLLEGERAEWDKEYAEVFFGRSRQSDSGLGKKGGGQAHD